MHADGTYIKIIKPAVDEHLYFNRKEYFCMNATIVERRKHFVREYECFDRASRLLGLQRRLEHQPVPANETPPEPCHVF